MGVALRVAAAVVLLTATGCTPTQESATAAAQLPEEWCNRQSMDAVGCRGAAYQEHAACASREGAAYDDCRRLWDRGRFRFLPFSRD